MSLVDINKNFKFADLTSIGLPEDKYDKILSSGLDNATLNIPGGPDKINFYAQAATDIDRQAMIDVLTIYNKEKGRLDKINTTSKDLRRLLRKVYKNYLIKDAKNVKRGGTNIIKGGESEFTAEINRLLEGRTELGELKAGDNTVNVRKDSVLRQLEEQSPARGVSIPTIDIKEMLEKIKNTETCCTNITTKIAELINQIGEKNAETVTKPIIQDLKNKIEELKTYISTASGTSGTSSNNSKEINELKSLIESINTAITEKNNSFEEKLEKILSTIGTIPKTEGPELEGPELEGLAGELSKDNSLVDYIQQIIASIQAIEVQRRRPAYKNVLGKQNRRTRTKTSGRFRFKGGNIQENNIEDLSTISRKKIRKSLRRELNGGWGHLLNLATTFVPGGLPMKIGLGVFQKAAPHLMNMAKNRLAQNPQLQQALQNPLLQQALQNPAIQSQMQNFIPQNLRPFTNMIQQQWQQPQYGAPPPQYQPIVPYRGPKYYGGNSSSSDYSDSEESNTSTIYGGELSYAFDPNTGETCLAEAEAIDYQNLQPTNGEAWERNPKNRGQAPPPCNENNPAIINWKQGVAAAATAAETAAGLAAAQNNQARANYNALQGHPQFQDVAQNQLNANYANQWGQAQNDALRGQYANQWGQVQNDALRGQYANQWAQTQNDALRGQYANQWAQSQKEAQAQNSAGPAAGPPAGPAAGPSTGPSAGPAAGPAAGPSAGPTEDIGTVLAEGKLDEAAAGILTPEQKKNFLKQLLDILKNAGTHIKNAAISGWELIKTFGGIAGAKFAALWGAIHSNPYSIAAFYGTLIIIGCVAINKMNPGNINEFCIKLIENFKQAIIKTTEKRRALQKIKVEQPNTQAAADAENELKKQENPKQLIADIGGQATAQTVEEQKPPIDENAKEVFSNRFKGFREYLAKYGKQIAIGTALTAAAAGLGAYAYKKVADGNYQWKEDELQKNLEKYISEKYGTENLETIKKIVDNVILDTLESDKVKSIGNVEDFKDNASGIYDALTINSNNDEQIERIIKEELNDELQNAQKGGNLSYPFIQFGGDLKENLQKYANLKNDNDKQDLIELIDEDPKYSPETTQIATIDRTIFIVGTYIIRTLVLLMIDWGINSHMITTFKQSFEAYISGYIALFLVWVAIANISENEYQENIVLSSLFYYINTRANNLTKFRILLHIFVQISLIPILYIVKYKSSEIDQDSFEQRQGLYNAISQFSFFIWLMTSIIASRF
jgi:hypothetical protein